MLTVVSPVPSDERGNKRPSLPISNYFDRGRERKKTASLNRSTDDAAASAKTANPKPPKKAAAATRETSLYPLFFGLRICHDDKVATRKHNV